MCSVLNIQSNNKACDINDKQDLINKALADPSFRQLLQTQPAKALGVTKLTPENTELVNSVLSAIKGAGGKLGTDGGPCGIASPATRALKKGGKSA